MKKKKYKIEGRVWLWAGENAPWHFVSVPKKETAQIKKDFAKLMRGWNSIRVEVKVGKTAWRTSIFYDTRSETYLLPLKASVRKNEEIIAGDIINFSIDIL